MNRPISSFLLAMFIALFSTACSGGGSGGGAATPPITENPPGDTTTPPVDGGGTTTPPVDNGGGDPVGTTVQVRLSVGSVFNAETGGYETTYSSPVTIDPATSADFSDTVFGALVNQTYSFERDLDFDQDATPDIIAFPMLQTYALITINGVNVPVGVLGKLNTSVARAYLVTDDGQLASVGLIGIPAMPASVDGTTVLRTITTATDGSDAGLTAMTLTAGDIVQSGLLWTQDDQGEIFYTVPSDG